MRNKQKISVQNSEQTTSEQPIKRKRGRPRKIRTPEELAEMSKPKLSREERMKLKLEKQKAYEARQQAKKDQSKYYVNNKELMAEIVKWKESAEKPEDRVMSEKLGEMIIKIADKCLNHSNFRHYSKELKEDMKSFFFYKTIRGLKNYNLEFNNPFAYMTMIAFNAYLTVIGNHYKNRNIKKDLMGKMLLELQSFSGLQSNSSLVRNIKQCLEMAEQEDTQPDNKSDD